MRRECDREAGRRKRIERVTGCGHGGQWPGQKICLLARRVHSYNE
jgi:hypothetical protein